MSQQTLRVKTVADVTAIMRFVVGRACVGNDSAWYTFRHRLIPSGFLVYKIAAAIEENDVSLGLSFGHLIDQHFHLQRVCFEVGLLTFVSL